MGFAAATAVRSVADGTFSAEVHDGWSIAGNANGGYGPGDARAVGSD